MIVELYRCEAIRPIIYHAKLCKYIIITNCEISGINNMPFMHSRKHIMFSAASIFFLLSKHQKPHVFFLKSYLEEAIVPSQMMFSSQHVHSSFSWHSCAQKSKPSITASLPATYYIIFYMY